MSKVITFSRTFPSYHPKAGQPTFFVEKLWESYQSIQSEVSAILTPIAPYIQDYKASNDFNYKKYGPKHHTIRAGNRFKVGEYFSPRVWSGIPYNSKQIIIAPDIEVVKTFTFQINKWGSIIIGSKPYSYFGEVCKNDGLEPPDFLNWFKIKYDTINKPFTGQIICWDKNIEY